MSNASHEPSLSHVTPAGEVHMVDVSAKAVTVRTATASAVVTARAEILDRLMSGKLPKGDALATARVAGIMAAKRCPEWIPLCHSLPLDSVNIEFERNAPNQLRIRCTARATARTGVEMEALAGAACAALTIYDMAKAADKAITIGPIQLEEKTGGKSGDFKRV